MKSKVACVFGASGHIGRNLIDELLKMNFNVRLGCRDKKFYEEYCSKYDEKCIFYNFDIMDKKKREEFCCGGDIIIGAAGPSVEYSELMLESAILANVPYVDPGGMHLLRKIDSSQINIPVVIGAGLFPGLSGWLLLFLANSEEKIMSIQMAIGGQYLFSRSSAIDFISEMHDKNSGIPLACINSGKVIAAKSIRPNNVPKKIDEYQFLPYITDEVKELSIKKGIFNIESYTIIEKNLFKVLNMKNIDEHTILQFQSKWSKKPSESLIWFRFIQNNINREKTFEAGDPNILTSKILALTSNAVVENELKCGIFTMAEYLENYPLLDKLNEMEIFNYT